MQEDGIVSLWVGTARSEGALAAALEVDFSEDGDCLGSPFSRAFGIARHGEGEVESAYYDLPADDLGTLLRGASYEDVIVPQFQRQAGARGPLNCVVLLFNHRPEGPSRWDGPGIELHLWGTARYVP